MISRRVLIVHYFFPPVGGAGVPRMLKFVKYLPEFGWDVAVVTGATTNRWYAARDEGLLTEVPASVHVVRARELPVAPLRRKLVGPLQRLKVGRLNSYLAWPDETIGWAPFALSAARRVARAWQPDVVLSSSYPYTAHLVGSSIARSLHVPWVADFRDPWTRNPQPEDRPWALSRLDARLERALVRRADAAIVVDERMELLGLEANDPRRVVIRNGVDEADFDVVRDVDPSPPPDRFRLTYVGSLYGTRDAAPVFDAIGRLIARGIIDADRFEVMLVGNVWLGDRDVELPGVRVERTGYVDHTRAVVEMHRGSALLFYAPPTTWAPSGKIFEYLLAGRPILAVARGDNLATQLVDELRAGATAAPDDAAGIEEAIASLYRAWADGTLRIDGQVRERTLARFSRRRLTEQLADVLTAVAVNPPGTAPRYTGSS